MWEDEEENNMETKNFEVGSGMQLTKWEYKETKCYKKLYFTAFYRGNGSIGIKNSALSFFFNLNVNIRSLSAVIYTFLQTDSTHEFLLSSDMSVIRLCWSISLIANNVRSAKNTVVNLSPVTDLGRPRGLQEFEVPRIFRDSAHDSGKDLALNAGHLYPHTPPRPEKTPVLISVNGFC